MNYRYTRVHLILPVRVGPFLAIMPPSDYAVEVATSDKRLREAYRLRLAVFADEQKYDKDRDMDQYVVLVPF